MDLFNRPPAIAEDTLFYALYPPEHLADKSSVTALAASILSYVDDALQGFIWHKDPFEVKVAQDPDTGLWLLQGTMRVGDCVDDEWYTAWLLREISGKWDLAVSVYDSDGEFLLIEAAESLPSWVQPSNSENRLWIYRSRLHLIPLEHVSSSAVRRRPRYKIQDDDALNDDDDVEDYIAVMDALKLVRNDLVETFAPENTERAVWARIAEYPDAASRHLHATNAYIPHDISMALSVEPSLIQKAVETFYTRDAFQLRVSTFASSSIRTHPPLGCSSPAYAQLIGQKFYPPKAFGIWKEQEGSKEWRWKDTGMKIAVGFEILYQESKAASQKINTSRDGVESYMNAQLDALRRNQEYMRYRQTLVSAGYFRGEMQGSQLWNQLEKKAVATFVQARQEVRMPFAAQINSALSQASSIAPPVEHEDPDSWLAIDPDNFEDVLNRKVNISGAEPQTEDGVAKEQTFRLQQLAQQVEEFVEGEGDIEGARFKDEGFSDEEFSDDNTSSDESMSEPSAREVAMNQLVPPLDPNDYGQMPPSYSRSQRTRSANIEVDAVPAAVPSTTRPIRKPIFTREKYDGVDSDDETDDEDLDSGEEEDQPQIIGDVEIDMEEEMDEFLEFSRQTLGITDEHWNEIIKERQNRGAYIPPSVRPIQTSSRQHTGSGRNPDLDSFEAVMQAMDAELAHQKEAKAKPSSSAKSVAVPKDDIEAAMDAELKNALTGDESDEDEADRVDYNLIKNFLESFKSQGGLSGPVSTLAGRLQPGWKLPRDES